MEDLVYTANEEFAFELIDMGFDEITESVYKDHYINMQKLGYYSPNSMKRAFERGKVRVRFDYIHIFIEYKVSRNDVKVIWDGYKIKEGDMFSYFFNPKAHIKKK